MKVRWFREPWEWVRVSTERGVHFILIPWRKTPWMLAHESEPEGQFK